MKWKKVAARRREDEQLERWVGVTLRTGAVTATSLLALGLVLQLAGVFSGLANLVSHVGLLVLIATPITRVVISVVDYAGTRDWAFLALTLAVLGMLTASFIVGIG